MWAEVEYSIYLWKLTSENINTSLQSPFYEATRARGSERSYPYRNMASIHASSGIYSARRKLQRLILQFQKGLMEGYPGGCVQSNRYQGQFTSSGTRTEGATCPSNGRGNELTIRTISRVMSDTHARQKALQIVGPGPSYLTSRDLFANLILSLQPSKRNLFDSLKQPVHLSVSPGEDVASAQIKVPNLSCVFNERAEEDRSNTAALCVNMMVQHSDYCGP